MIQAQTLSLIVGGSSGMGKETAKRLLKQDIPIAIETPDLGSHNKRP